MKRPTLVRDRVLARMIDMLEHLRLQVSMWLPDETDVLLALNRPQQYDLAEDLSKMLFERLGGPVPQVKEKRFDKTHRATCSVRAALDPDHAPFQINMRPQQLARLTETHSGVEWLPHDLERVHAEACRVHVRHLGQVDGVLIPGQ